MVDSRQAVERAQEALMEAHALLAGTLVGDGLRASPGPTEKAQAKIQLAARCVRALAAALADTERERGRLAEELRLREQSQIPVIPAAAMARLDVAEARVSELEAALETICDIGETRDVQVARAALAAAELKEPVE